MQQRINWHIEHQKNCSCRPIPQKILDEINAKKMFKKYFLQIELIQK